MRKIFVIMMLTLALTSCERKDVNTPSEKIIERDNTGVNVRDRDNMVKTPMNQSESDANLTITQKIRQAIMADDSLSTNAKNIKVITMNGVVTLRGPVDSAVEKDKIAQKVKDVPGILSVDNQLEVVSGK